MNESKILGQNRLSFIKDISHFSNYETRIMKLIPSQNPDDSIDDIFDNGKENRFFFALYSLKPINVKFFQDESESLLLLDHPSINKLIGISSNLNTDSPDSIVSALYQDIPYYTIASRLSSLNHTQKIIILYGVASALKYLQTNNIFFYDLNTSQMYLNKESEPILDGYGFSCFQPCLSDISFVAPELLTYINYYKNLHNNNIKEENDPDIDLSKASIYAFGYFMIEILTEKKPVLLRRASDRYFYSFPINLSKQYHNIITNCINFRPEDRLTFDDILMQLQDVVNQNDGISSDFFKMYSSKFTDIKLLSISLPIFNYPLSCFIKPDTKDSDDEIIDEFTLNPILDSNQESNQSADTKSDINSNQDQNTIPNENKTETTNSNTDPNADQNTNSNSTKNVKIIENTDTNVQSDLTPKSDPDNNTNTEKQVTMPSIGMPKVRYRQHPDQARSARSRQFQYSQINGQNYYNNRNQQQSSGNGPNTARPRNSLNLAQMYSRNSNIFSFKSSNQGTNGNSNVPLLSFREFQSRMFQQEQTPNISFINSENDIEILKKRNDPDSQYILGYYYETKEKFEEAFDLYKNASVRGHSQALYRQGLLLMNGQGCKRNMKKASQLFLRSAKQRNTDAAYQFILLHGKQITSKKTEMPEFEIKMPKEPNTTRDRKSGRRNLRKSEPQPPKQAQSARIAKKRPKSPENEEKDDELSEFDNTAKYPHKKDDTKSEVPDFTLESTSNSTTSTTSKDEVDIENELRICMNYLQYSADIGFADSIFKLAILYEQGICYEKDLNKSFSYYKRAADRGVTEASYRTASMMLEGRGTSRAFNEAAFYLQKAARKGHIDAIFKCGQLFESGIGVTKNIEKAAEFYKEASLKGHVLSKRSYARIIRESSVKEQKKLRSKGRSKSPQNENIKEVHYTPIVNDDKLAFKLMKEAAEAGDNEALSELGEMYRDGFGTTRNLRNALLCFKKASSIQSFSSSSSTNSSSVSSSSSSSFNFSSADNEPSFSVQSFKVENKNGLNDHFVLNNNSFYNDIVNKSSSNLNLIYSSRSGLVSGSGSCSSIYSSTPNFVDRETFSEDFLESSQSSPSLVGEQRPSSRALVNLGLMYEQGLATQIDLKKASKYFRMSADLRDPLGQFHLARALENGVGLPVDLKQAAKFYRLSANQGFSRAQFNIARYLEFGLGIQQDKSLAIQFYKCAARQGIKAAEVALKRLKPNCL